MAYLSYDQREHFAERFNAIKDEHESRNFSEIAKPRSSRKDLHALLLLAELDAGSTKAIICAAEHDIIYVGVDLASFVDTITDEQLIELAICGMMFDDDGDGFSMYV